VTKVLNTKKHEAKEKVEEFVEEKFQVKKIIKRIEIKERECVVIMHLKSLEIQ
jgi:hypothetical protein